MIFPRFIRLAWILLAFMAILYTFGCVYAPPAPAPPKVSISSTVEVVLEEGIDARASTRPTEKPGQAEATEIVWRQQYEMGTIAPPTIVWMEGTRLDCGKGRAEDGRLIGGWEANQKHLANKINHGWFEPDAAEGGGFPPCVSGAFDPATYTIQLAWPPGTVRFSTISFAHELAHARSFRLMGYANHQGFDFAPKGRVYQADRALRRAGL